MNLRREDKITIYRLRKQGVIKNEGCIIISVDEINLR